MVKRFSRANPVDSASERRAAQRQLAREIHTGTYVPTGIGKISENVVKNHRQLEKELYDLKKTWFGDNSNWNKTGHVKKTLRNSTIKQLRDAIKKIQEWVDDPTIYEQEVADGPDYDSDIAFYYH